MGYLNNTQVSVEAILTKKGREILSKGGDFSITKFSLADDEVDYNLWNTTHPLGTQFFGSAIENLPILEASPDETQVMRFKLVTLPKSTTRMPLLDLGFTSIQLNGTGAQILVKPRTRFFANDTLGFTAILTNASFAFLEVEEVLDQTVVPTVPTFLRDDEQNQSVTAVGRSFRLIAKDVTSLVGVGGTVSTTLTVIGNQSGAKKTIPVTITTLSSVIRAF